MRLKTLSRVALSAFLLAAVAKCGDDWTYSAAAATPLCGGQGAENFVGPAGFDCRQIGQFQGVGYELKVHVNADRTFGLTFTLAHAVNVKVGLQARAHPHLSGDPGVMESFTTLPAGQVSTVLGGQFPAGNLCDPHQLDVKAQPGVEGSGGHWDEKWRISGATFVFATPATGCGVTTVPTTAPTTAPGSTTPPTTAPQSTTASTQANSTSSGPGASVVAVTLPATGNEPSGGVRLALLLLVLGSAGIVIEISRRRARS